MDVRVILPSVCDVCLHSCWVSVGAREPNCHYHFFVQARPCDNDDNDGHSNEASCDNDDGNDDNDGGRDGVRMLRLESSAWI